MCLEDKNKLYKQAKEEEIELSHLFNKDNSEDAYIENKRLLNGSNHQKLLKYYIADKLCPSFCPYKTCQHKGVNHVKNCNFYQYTFDKIISTIKDFKENGDLINYIKVIAKNTAKNYFKKLSVRPDKKRLTKEFNQKMTDIFSNFPKSFKIVINLNFQEKITYEEAIKDEIFKVELEQEQINSKEKIGSLKKRAIDRLTESIKPKILSKNHNLNKSANNLVSKFLNLKGKK